LFATSAVQIRQRAQCRLANSSTGKNARHHCHRRRRCLVSTLTSILRIVDPSSIHSMSRSFVACVARRSASASSPTTTNEIDRRRQTREPTTIEKRTSCFHFVLANGRRTSDAMRCESLSSSLSLSNEISKSDSSPFGVRTISRLTSYVSSSGVSN
jgi:hypothetical protein